MKIVTYSLTCKVTRRLFWLATHQITRLSSSLTLPSATASLTAQPATIASRDMNRVNVPAARQNADNNQLSTSLLIVSLALRLIHCLLDNVSTMEGLMICYSGTRITECARTIKVFFTINLSRLS